MATYGDRVYLKPVIDQRKRGSRCSPEMHSSSDCHIERRLRLRPLRENSHLEILEMLYSIGLSLGSISFLGDLESTSSRDSIMLDPYQTGILVFIFVVMATATTVHWILIHRATRGMPHRPLRWGFGFWYPAMLRRSWYPLDGQHFYPWILGTYFIELAAVLIGLALVVRWLHAW